VTLSSKPAKKSTISRGRGAKDDDQDTLPVINNPYEMFKVFAPKYLLWGEEEEKEARKEE